MTEARHHVLDSFALLAVFFNERGGPRVVELFNGPAVEERFSLCVVNFGEVLYRLENVGDARTAAQAMTRIRAWPLELVEVDEALAIAAAKVKAQLGMGYLDCFVVALAQRLNATIVTGDPDFRRVEDLIPIEWLGR